MANQLSIPLVRHQLPFVVDLAPGQHPVDHADQLACRQDQRPLMAWCVASWYFFS
ncbi:hypothetical protein SAMN00768000_3143 [Sulfobacillus thermosulfidooxidans DSM 9293]|uniref:Uncharacterized protein n=1 Tax=Sulfobacillus thermosulfidooxidans (strain DSM 9293 / VKM B-1269 / AT-1) TaxID=929705 RepID=A0A1W1WKZ9_SULTA|nr:hypothetical protein SAMN00768000_3143 [Sulfobacillus thermosulfidooxidans DSM 9293]